MIAIDFAKEDDLPQLADLLAELFTLESDFRPERDNRAALDFNCKPGFASSPMKVLRKIL